MQLYKCPSLHPQRTFIHHKEAETKTETIPEEQRHREGKRMASSECPGKSSWPELVGVKGEVAKATVERENPDVHALILPEGTPVTDDLRCNRVRVWVNKENIVIQVPVIG